MTPAVLETHYVRLVTSARRARAWAKARDASLAIGDRDAAAEHLTRYWMSVRLARYHLQHAWPGLEIFARRAIASRWPRASESLVEQTLVSVRRRLSKSPPPAPGVPGLYGCLRRLVRDEGEAVIMRMPPKRSGPRR